MQGREGGKHLWMILMYIVDTGRSVWSVGRACTPCIPCTTWWTTRVPSECPSTTVWSAWSASLTHKTATMSRRVWRFVHSTSQTGHVTKVVFAIHPSCTIPLTMRFHSSAEIRYNMVQCTKIQYKHQSIARSKQQQFEYPIFCYKMAEVPVIIHVTYLREKISFFRFIYLY